MTKNKYKKKKRDNKRAEAIKMVAAGLGVQVDYVRMVINEPQYKYGKADEIRRLFKEKYDLLKKILA